MPVIFLCSMGAIFGIIGFVMLAVGIVLRKKKDENYRLGVILTQAGVCLLLFGIILLILGIFY